MATRQFRRGDILFSEGDPVDGVLSVRTGTVEVLRRRDGAEFVLGLVRAGQFLGEMSVAENRPRRSATARAATDGEAEFMDAAEFLAQISRSPEGARTLIDRLCRRLHDMEDRIVEDEQRLQPRVGKQGLGDRSAVEGLILATDTPQLRAQLDEPRTVNAVPFLVGRAILPGESPPPRQLDLELQDHVPLRLSRNHFAIISRDGRLFVRDLRSTLGTMVNGRSIGEHFGSDEAPLVIGENEVIAGGKDSPFAFFITVSEAGVGDQEASRHRSLPNGSELF